MKKKLFSLLTLALLGMSSAWAEDITVGRTVAFSAEATEFTVTSNENAVTTISDGSGSGATGAKGVYYKTTSSVTMAKELCYRDYYNSANLTAFNKNVYAGIKIVIPAGKMMTVTNIQASLAVSTNFTSKVIVYDESENILYQSADKAISNYNKASASNVDYTITPPTTLTLAGTVYVRMHYWNTGNSGTKYLVPLKLNVTGAISEAVSYTVTFDAGSNGTCATSSLTEESAGAGVTLPAVTPNSGYIFNGWFTAASEGTKVGIAGNTYKPTANITLYAQYTAEAAPTISIDNAAPSTTRGTAITLTATATGAPTPTVTWYQSETATTSGGTEVGTGSTYKPNVAAEGTFYFYAVASNGVGSDATSSLVTLTVTNPDITITGNNFYIAVGDLAIPQQNIICDDITMQYSIGDFTAATEDETVKGLVSGFVASVNCSTNGWGVTFTPSKTGLLKVGVVVNKDKTLTITNVTGFSYQTKNPDGSGTIEANTWAPSEKKYSVITIAVQAGTNYKFSVAGSKMGFYGFEFTPATATTVNLNASGYATLSAYYPVEVSGAKAYTATLDFENSKITCAEITGGQVPAGAGVLLYGDPNAEVTLTPIASAAALGSNDLKGTTKADGTLATKGSDNYYVLSGDTFKKFTGDAFGANKAYFEVAAGGAARALNIVFDGEATGIKSVSNGQSTMSNEVYDLQGRRVVQPTKGLYIVNGKKVIK